MIKLLTLLPLLFFGACQSESGISTLPRKIELITPAGQTIKTTLAISPAEQEQGLSGVRPDEFSENQGLFFFYLEDDVKYFWMPDTYFELDIIFLDKDLKVLDIIRKLPFYVGRSNQELIPRARGVWARYALEMKSTSEIARKIKVGDHLKWEGALTPQELDQKLRGLKP
jgi:uncharacterized membrane protein (UPF0127 family)